MENHNQYNWSTGQDLIPGKLEYKAETLSHFPYQVLGYYGVIGHSYFLPQPT
jgi:hypothetical protein